MTIKLSETALGISHLKKSPSSVQNVTFWPEGGTRRNVVCNWKSLSFSSSRYQLLASLFSYTFFLMHFFQPLAKFLVSFTSLFPLSACFFSPLLPLQSFSLSLSPFIPQFPPYCFSLLHSFLYKLLSVSPSLPLAPPSSVSLSACQQPDGLFVFILCRENKV